MIAIGSDHGGFALKQEIMKHLEERKLEYIDFGTYSSDSCDYPDFAHQVGSSINNGTYKRGIVICGSGNGVQMTVNKYPNVRCALCWNVEIAHLARQHNDANILSLPARFISEDLAMQILKEYLETPFEGGRHQRRVEKINKLI